MSPVDDVFDGLTDSSVRSAIDTLPFETIRIPRIEEQIAISTQTVETGRVTLTKTVHQAQETVTVPLTQEQYIVERTVVNQYVDEPPAPRQEGNSMIYPVLREVLVIEKKLLLVEEVRVSCQQTQTEDTQTVLLRRESITVERTPPAPIASSRTR